MARSQQVRFLPRVHWHRFSAICLRQRLARAGGCWTSPSDCELRQRVGARMINVVFFPYRPQYWDDAFVEPLFDGKSWVPPCQHEFKCFRYDLDKVPFGEGAVVIVSARAWVDHKCKMEDLNKLLDNLYWALVIVTGDEEGLFPH